MKKNNMNWLKTGISLTVLFTIVMTSLPQMALAWDAGTESRRHSEGIGGEKQITIFDTRPYWAKSTAFTSFGNVANCPEGYRNDGLTCFRDVHTYSAPSILASCESGYTNMGLYCQKSPPFGATSTTMVCPAGYFMGAAKRCFQNCRPGYTNNGETCGRGAHALGISSMTCAPNQSRVEVVGAVPRCYDKPECPSGYEPFGVRCYISPPPGGKRTALSTVTMDVKMSANTHLWIVNRALDLLSRSNDASARAFAAKMNEPAVRSAWENGLWDGDDSNNSDFPNNMGTHFYNAAGKDWSGNPTTVKTYNVVKGSIIPIATGIIGAATGGAGALGGASTALIIESDEVGARTFKNNKSCANSRECAKAQIETIKTELNASNAYALGLALHYMTDATQPMHTSGYDGFKIPNNLHPQYEYYAGYVQDKSPSSGMSWDKRWGSQDADSVFHQAANKSNGFATRLMNALHYKGDAGIVTIEGFNGIGPYTGYNIYNDSEIDKVTDEILRDAYQSTASYLYAVSKKVSITANVPTTNPNRPGFNLSGTWKGFDANGNQFPNPGTITQAGQSLTFNNGGGSTSSGTINGNQLSAADWGVTGTLSEDGTKISWSNNTTWVKNTTGTSGTGLNLIGNWVGYYADGTKSPYIWSISQTGTNLTMTDVGAGSNAKSKGRIVGNRVFADDFGTNGTLSADGRTITWNDGVKWVKQ